MGNDWNSIFGSMRVGKMHPHVKKMEPADQYRLLALYIDTHCAGDCDDDGWFLPSLRKLVVELFGFKADKLKNFMGRLSAYGLFEHNGGHAVARRYRVLRDGEFAKFEAQYKTYVAKASKPGPASPPPNGTNPAAESEENARWTVEEIAEHVLGSNSPQRGLPIDALRQALADRVAADIMQMDVIDGHTLAEDPQLAVLVAQRVIELAWDSK